MRSAYIGSICTDGFKKSTDTTPDESEVLAYLVCQRGYEGNSDTILGSLDHTEF